MASAHELKTITETQTEHKCASFSATDVQAQSFQYFTGILLSVLSPKVLEFAALFVSQI